MENLIIISYVDDSMCIGHCKQTNSGRAMSIIEIEREGTGIFVSIYLGTQILIYNLITKYYNSKVY